MATRKKDSDPRGGTTGASQRQLRVGEINRHAIADILAQGGVHDPALEGHIITVPEVRMSPDLKLATVYVMPLGGNDTKLVLSALDRNKKFLRGEIAHRVNLKFAPDIRFRADDEVFSGRVLGSEIWGTVNERADWRARRTTPPAPLTQPAS